MRCTIRPAQRQEASVDGKRIPVSFRVTPRFKRALELASQIEQRSQTNLVEKLVFDFCKRAGIDIEAASATSTVKRRAKA